MAAIVRITHVELKRALKLASDIHILYAHQPRAHDCFDIVVEGLPFEPPHFIGDEFILYHLRTPGVCRED